MGFEITYKFHPRDESGKYDEEKLGEKTVKVGQPFDDTSLEKCAAAITSCLARRDVFVVDVSVHELVRREVTFKEARDGNGIILKGKRFSLNQTSGLISETTNTETVPSQRSLDLQPHEKIDNRLPHERIQMARNEPASENLDTDQLYEKYQDSIPIKPLKKARDIDKTKMLYMVYFEPYGKAVAAAQQMKLKFVPNKKYPVHSVIPSPTGKLDAQKIAVSDDEGNVTILDESFFTRVGKGLLGDEEVGFSDPVEIRPRLSYEGNQNNGIPVDTGYVPPELMSVPDLRGR